MFNITNKLIGWLVCFLMAFVSPVFSYSVSLGWDYSCSSNVSGYKVYYGWTNNLPPYQINTVLDCNGNTITNVFYGTIFYDVMDVGNTNVAIIPNLKPNIYYYFSSTCYNTPLGVESGYSSQVYSMIVDTNNYTYVGIEVDYGTNLTLLQSQKILTMVVTNNPGYFYNEQLIITNNPFIGTNPVDGNNYVYIGTIIQYGLDLTALNSSIFSLMTFTNTSNQYYRRSLIITNNPF